MVFFFCILIFLKRIADVVAQSRRRQKKKKNKHTHTRTEKHTEIRVIFRRRATFLLLFFLRRRRRRPPAVWRRSSRTRMGRQGEKSANIIIISVRLGTRKNRTLIHSTRGARIYFFVRIFPPSPVIRSLLLFKASLRPRGFGKKID